MVVSQIAAAVPYAWPFDASFSQETTALVIIDMQNDFCTNGGYITHQGHDISGARAIIPAIQAVLHAFRKAGWQVYHTREGSVVPAVSDSLHQIIDQTGEKAIARTYPRSPLERLSGLATTLQAKASARPAPSEDDFSFGEARDTTSSLNSIQLRASR